MSKRNKVGDELLRKKNARLRFKRLLRVALNNVQWITELELAGITMNVKKNVAMLVRKKHKTGILTMDVSWYHSAHNYQPSIIDPNSRSKKACWSLRTISAP